MSIFKEKKLEIETPFLQSPEYIKLKVEIINGEISCISTRNNYGGLQRLYLKRNSNDWKYAKKYLEDICNYSIETFVKVNESLKKKSKGHAIIKEIVQNKIKACNLGAEDTLEMKKFWESF